MKLRINIVLIWMLVLGAATALPGAARAAELRDITYSIQPLYIDVRLSFDSLPEYSSSFRYAPDRYVLSFSGCTLKVPDAKRTELAKLDSRLLTRISTYAQAGPPPLTQIGFYLNMRLDPLIRVDGASYVLRFPVQSSNEFTAQVAAGISLTIRDRMTENSSETVYLLRVQPGAKLRVTAAGADRYDGKTRLRAPSSFASRENADAVINGGFFSWGGQHLSTFIEDGFVRAAGVYPNRPMLLITPGGQVQIGRFTAATALLVTEPGQERATRIPISGKNTPFESGRVIAYDSRYPRETLPKGGMFYYLLQAERLSYAGEDPARAAVPADGFLVATDIIPEANPLRRISAGAGVVLETKLTDAQGQTIHAQHAIGGGPQLVENGVVNISTVEDSIKADISASERARTAAALTRSGELLLAVVKESKESGHKGVSLRRLADILVAEGALTALNFDGGGSSAMVVAGQLLNIASGSERPVSNVLVVKAGGGSPAASPADPAAGQPVKSPELGRGPEEEHGDESSSEAGDANEVVPHNKYQRKP